MIGNNSGTNLKIKIANKLIIQLLAISIVPGAGFEISKYSQSNKIEF